MKKTKVTRDETRRGKAEKEEAVEEKGWRMEEGRREEGREGAKEGKRKGKV